MSRRRTSRPDAGGARKGQQQLVDAVRKWAEAGAKVTPDLPTLPLADLLPKPDEVAAIQFDFAEKLLANQRQFAEELLAASRPETS
jgi:hypothetical protein